MQADSMLPEQQRRHYRGVADAFMRITKEEGIPGLYRGVGPNIARAMALNCGMLASNDQVGVCWCPHRLFACLIWRMKEHGVTQDTQLTALSLLLTKNKGT